MMSEYSRHKTFPPYATNSNISDLQGEEQIHLSSFLPSSFLSFLFLSFFNEDHSSNTHHPLQMFDVLSLIISTSELAKLSPSSSFKMQVSLREITHPGHLPPSPPSQEKRGGREYSEGTGPGTGGEHKERKTRTSDRLDHRHLVLRPSPSWYAPLRSSTAI